MKGLNNYPYQHVLVLGLAKSGTAAANVLLKSGINVRINDFNAEDTSQEVIEWRNRGAEVIVGAHPLSALDNIELIVKNPGIPYENVLLVEAQNRKIPIVTEIELAANVAGNNELIAITGSNGKTTTTTLVQAIFEKSNEPARLAGNIGVVATDIAQQLNSGEKMVLELSSFQLMGIQHFRPHIAALLNLFEAHLDYHGSLQGYMNAKANIFKNQTTDDYLIYNADDERVTAMVKNAKSQLIPFSTQVQQTHGAWMDEEGLYFRNDKVIDKRLITLVGEHNVQNILAAISVSLLSGATIEGIREVLTTFTGVEHRLQFVKELDGRIFYNDSKATNMLATQKALESFNQPIILLAGGLDRGDTYETLLPYLNHVKAMVLFGETKEKLKETAQMAGVDAKYAADVKEAAKLAYDMSQVGDIILLSPACASWDQYKTFEERGNMFVQTVHILA